MNNVKCKWLQRHSSCALMLHFSPFYLLHVSSIGANFKKRQTCTVSLRWINTCRHSGGYSNTNICISLSKNSSPVVLYMKKKWSTFGNAEELRNVNRSKWTEENWIPVTLDFVTITEVDRWDCSKYTPGKVCLLFQEKNQKNVKLLLQVLDYIHVNINHLCILY